MIFPFDDRKKSQFDPAMTWGFSKSFRRFVKPPKVGDVQGRTLDVPEGISHINRLYPHAMFGRAIHAWEDKSSTSFSLEA